MRILVQQQTNGLYLTDSGSWTRQSVKAMEFVSSADAIDHCIANHISGVHLVLKFEDQAYDIVLPIQPVTDALLAPRLACA